MAMGTLLRDEWGLSGIMEMFYLDRCGDYTDGLLCIKICHYGRLPIGFSEFQCV